VLRLRKGVYRLHPALGFPLGAPHP
jgi:hypothetical protein